MLTITRRQAQQLRAVLRRTFGNFRGPGPAVRITASAGTLSARAMFGDAAVEYRIPGQHMAETLWLPLQCLADCEGKKDDPVELAAAGKGRVSAQWRDGSVPQLVQYDSPEPPAAHKFPVLPATFTENPPGILQALADAGESCDPDSTRFALGHIQLRHDGAISATDGRQILVQSGFTFPWDDAVLIPRSKVFSSPELPHDVPAAIARSGDWVVISVGPWTISLAINKDGRFPELARHIPQPADATARCRFSAADAAFLGNTLPRLPCDDVANYPITLDLNGHVAIRAKSADQPRPTEVVLTGSEWSGEPIRINTNRKFLARAVKLGFQEMFVYGDTVPVLCRDDRRQYVWALLAPDSVIKPADDAIRIESPSAGAETPVTQPQIVRKVSTLPEPVTNANGNAAANGNGQTNGHAKTNGHARTGAARKPGHNVDSLIRQAEALRTSLRDTLLKTNDLLRGLKQHRRQNRAVQNTLASLKQLKTLSV